MYEAYDAKTGELRRVDLDELERFLADGSLTSEPKQAAKKANKDENKG